MNLTPIYKGKVRDIYEVDSETLLIVSSNRISAFDVIFNEEIPNKGRVLNTISSLWFLYFQNQKSKIFPNSTLQEKLNFKTHFITNDFTQYPKKFQIEKFKDCSMLVYKTKKIPFECIVRGYLAGSAWKEYKETRKVCDIRLPEGLQLGSKLPEILFTPSTKEEAGHDTNVSFQYLVNQIGIELAHKIKEISIAIFKEASIIMESIGFLLCDTKFEFGIKDQQIYLIDEVLTPDSSRFWKKEEYHLGTNLASYDKQLLRDYLESIQWNKQPPPPSIPKNIIEELIKRYEDIEKKLKLALTL